MPSSETPKRIGRYEILGQLATGGMAEVLLGRLRGPFGFERPVVVKRILPHLALDRRVVDMFLDEARIIAKLRHKNLVQVHELGTEGGELFLAMEFLEGESVSGLCRRLAQKSEHLDFGLVAYIMAEACAGLHAAHEARSADGAALEIIHRDVSPQNLFVSYSGVVHVIDFGIATAADRITRTETGTIKGKFEYLAPEQLRAQPVDRRADVFALGVVLFELTTGRRLYKRGSPAESMMAILSERVPDLTTLRPDVPADLHEICLRALAKAPRDRYPTANAMRQELLAFARKQTDTDLGELLEKRMRELFSDRLGEKAALLQRAQEGSRIETLPLAEVDIDVEIPTALAAPTEAASAASPNAPAPSGRGRSRRLIAVIGVATLVVLGTLPLAWRRATSAPALAPTAESDLPSAASSSSSSTVSLNEDRPVVAAPEPSSEPSVSRPSPSHKPARPRPTRIPTSAAAPPTPTPAPTLW